MCRYGFKYKNHFICLDCRKQFRQSDQYAANLRTCPDCTNDLTPVGKDFKPPRRNNKKQWRKIAALIADGITFSSCGCDGPGPMPKTWAEYKANWNTALVGRKWWHQSKQTWIKK